MLQFKTLWLDQLNPDEERRTIADTLSRMAEATHRKPLGWLGAGLAETWHTLEFPPRRAFSMPPTGSTSTSPIRWMSAAGCRTGRVMAICLHPYLIGVPHRIPGLDWALHYIRAHERVGFATGEEIVRR
jgi:hypothetical protein